MFFENTLLTDSWAKALRTNVFVADPARDWSFLVRARAQLVILFAQSLTSWCAITVSFTACPFISITCTSIWWSSCLIVSCDMSQPIGVCRLSFFMCVYFACFSIFVIVSIPTFLMPWMRSTVVYERFGTDFFLLIGLTSSGLDRNPMQ